MGLWDKAGSNTLNQAQNTVSDLCKAANLTVGQLTDNGGIINLVIRGTRKQHCYVELTNLHNLQIVMIYSPATSLPVSDLPPTKVILDIMGKVNPDPLIRWTVYLSKRGDYLLSCAAANTIDFYKSRPDLLSYYVKTVSIHADDLEKMTGKDEF